MKIEFTTSPKYIDIDFITNQINKEATGYGAAYSFAFFIRNDKDKIIASCNGSVVYGAIHTDQLFVEKIHRKQKLGSKLMKAVHEYALLKECKIATVCTMSFQGATEFYKLFGYEVDFERKGYENGASCLFLKKEL